MALRTYGTGSMHAVSAPKKKEGEKIKKKVPAEGETQLKQGEGDNPINVESSNGYRVVWSMNT